MQKTMYNQTALEALKIKYDYSLDYIRKCISGARVGVMPNKVKLDYQAIVDATNQAAKEQIQKLS